MNANEIRYLSAAIVSVKLAITALDQTHENLERLENRSYTGLALEYRKNLYNMLNLLEIKLYSELEKAEV